ncbi:MAG TPA: DUF1449 family protein [Fimbriimonadaceae bacterium]|nr:DUF1449 family protein [Fimbriimonadaceae bacterium]HRE92740.1 DUF1449 family protein [Fimbriimonadaceae bacterium]
MVKFLLAPQNIPFLVAYIIMLAFAVLTLVVGAMDNADADAEVDIDADGLDFGDHVLSYLGIGKVPFTMLLVSFAWSFGSCGYIVQFVFRSMAGMVSPWVASAIALVPALLLHGLVAKGLRQITDRDDSTAVHSDSFVGKLATVTLGETQRGKPTQAKLRDQHGQTHYVLVEPHREEDTLLPGQEVILVARQGSLYEAMPNDIDLITADLRVGNGSAEEQK